MHLLTCKENREINPEGAQFRQPDPGAQPLRRWGRGGENQRGKERFREKMEPQLGLEGGVETAKGRACQMRNGTARKVVRQ